MNKLRTLILVISTLVVSNGFAANAGANYRDIPTDQNMGLQLDLCELNEGYSLDDVAKINKRLSEGFAKLDINASIMHLTPFFTRGALFDPRPDYATMIVAPIPEFGSGWDKWTTSEEASELVADSEEVSRCIAKFHQGIPKHFDVDEIQSTDRRILTFQWCSRRPGVSIEQLRNRHDNYLQSIGEEFPAATWHILVPRLGGGPGDWAHMQTYTSAASLMSNESRLATGGFRSYNDYHNTYVDCGDTNVWNGTYVHKRK